MRNRLAHRDKGCRAVPLRDPVRLELRRDVKCSRREAVRASQVPLDLRRYGKAAQGAPIVTTGQPGAAIAMTGSAAAVTPTIVRQVLDGAEIATISDAVTATTGAAATATAIVDLR